MSPVTTDEQNFRNTARSLYCPRILQAQKCSCLATSKDTWFVLAAFGKDRRQGRRGCFTPSRQRRRRDKTRPCDGRKGCRPHHSTCVLVYVVHMCSIMRGVQYCQCHVYCRAGVVCHDAIRGTDGSGCGCGSGLFLAVSFLCFFFLFRV